MEKFEALYQTHRDEIVVGRKTAKELIHSLGDFVDAVPVELERLPKWLLDRLIWNLEHHYGNTVKKGQMEYQLFCVAKNEKSLHYYKDYIEWAGYDIWILLEMKTGEFQTNCSGLARDLWIFRGISPTDIESRTMCFKAYLGNFDVE